MTVPILTIASANWPNCLGHRWKHGGPAGYPAKRRTSPNVAVERDYPNDRRFLPGTLLPKTRQWRQGIN